jgi:hypothetical protein
MVWHGLLAKAAPVVATSVMGAMAYEATRKALSQAPLRKSAVVATAWGMRVARAAQRQAEEKAERARLTVADVLAEAKELAGQDFSPMMAGSGGDNDH